MSFSENSNRPGYMWWKKVVDKTLHLRFKPMAVDICNTCQIYQNYAQDAKDECDEVMAKRYEQELKEHLHEANFGYQCNSFMIKWCHQQWIKRQKQQRAKQEEEEKKEQLEDETDEQSQLQDDNEEYIEQEVEEQSWNKLRNKFANPLLILSSGTFTFKPGTAIHITIDWDKDRNEFQRQHKRFYNKEKPQFVSLNIKIEPMTGKGM